MCKMTWRQAALFFPVAVALLFSSAWAQTGGEVMVYAIGSSRIPKGDMAAGREEAINAGLIMAVSRALADTLPMASVVGHFQAVNESILNRTDRFVQDYKVLTESVMGDSYRVIMQATVSIDRLKDAIQAVGLRLGDTPYPRVLLCMAEKDRDDLTAQNWWSGRPQADENITATVVSQMMAEKGFIMIQHDFAAMLPGASPELSAAEAVDLGRRFDAEVVVAGFASVDTTGVAQANMPPFRASVRATAYSTADGRPLSQIEKQVAPAAGEESTDGGEALRRAAAQAGEALAEKLADAWFTQAALGTGIEIRVQGVGGNIANLVRFRGALGGVSGVDNLQMKELASDTAVLTATYQGSARALADAVRQLNFSTFQINIVQVNADHMDVQLLPR